MITKDYVVCCVVNEDDGSITPPVSFETLGQALKWYRGYKKQYEEKVGTPIMRLIRLCELSIDIEEQENLACEPYYKFDTLKINGALSAWDALDNVIKDKEVE